MQGRGSGKVRDFALYGETTGETDEFGLPVRYNWAAEYRGAAMVVYGHTPVPEPEWLNRTINIDTGCVFGGKLTALRYPEREFVSVPAARTYCEPARPFLPAERAGPDAHGPAGARRPARRRRRARQADRHDPAARQRDDPGGERHRRAGGDEPVRRRPEVADLPAADHVARARRAREPGLLEHPAEAFAYYRDAGRRRRSSARRSTWARGRSSSSAATRRRHASASASPTARLGDRLHPHRAAVLQRPGAGARAPRPGARRASTAAGLWDELDTDWVLPRLRADAVVGQGPGAAARRSTRRSARPAGAALPRAVAALDAARGRAGGDDRRPARRRHRGPPRSDVGRYRRRLPALLLAGRRRSTDLKLAPFHLLATERARPHRQEPRLAHGDARRRLPGRPGRCCWRPRTSVVDVTDPASVAAGVAWWDELTGARRRGDGGQAARLHRRAAGAGSRSRP